MIGPFWITLSMFGVVLGMTLVFTGIFGSPTEDYLPYISLSLPTWLLLSQVMNEGSAALFQHGGVNKNIALPFSIHILKIILTNVIIYAHNLVPFVVVLIAVGHIPGPEAFVAVGGFALTILNLGWMALLVGLIGARFRDVPLVVATAMQVLMFMTPVFWRPEQLTSRHYVLHGNPFYYLIDAIRGPLLGHVQAETYIVLAIMAPLGWLVTLFVFSRVYRHVSYWL